MSSMNTRRAYRSNLSRLEQVLVHGQYRVQHMSGSQEAYQKYLEQIKIVATNGTAKKSTR